MTHEKSGSDPNERSSSLRSDSDGDAPSGASRASEAILTGVRARE